MSVKGSGVQQPQHGDIHLSTLGWSVTLLLATKLLSQPEVKFHLLKVLLGVKTSTDTECIHWKVLYASIFAISTISKNQCCVQLRADQIKVYK